MRSGKVEAIYIGIDGGNNVGFAVWSKKLNSFIEMMTYDFWSCIQRIEVYKLDCDISDQKLVVVVEDVSQNKPVFKLLGVFNHTPGNTASKLGAAGKVAESVGRVKESSDLIIAYCEKKNIDVVRKRPSGRSMTKLDSDMFKRITGYAQRTNQHVRDAGMIVFKM